METRKALERRITWPAVPPAEIAEPNTDEFYEKCVLVDKVDGVGLTVTTEVCASVELPYAAMAFASDEEKTAEAVAVMVIERLLLDINVDLLPALVRKLRQAGLK